MTVPPPDGSRDRRIEDPTNLWVIHPAGRALLSVALRLGVSANAVSVAGLLLGAGAALAYAHWQSGWTVLLGLLLSAGWLIADGLDGMVARATGTASALGRFLDGLCDHGVFALLYVALAWSIGTAEAWALAVLAGTAHAVQSSLYEGERARFHRRVKGLPAAAGTRPPAANGLVRGYDRLATLPERLGVAFERRLAHAADPLATGRRYGEAAMPAMRAMAMLTANVRVWSIAVACLLADPKLFWWFEIVVLTIVAAVTMGLHRRAERAVAGPLLSPEREHVASALQPRDYRHS